MSSCPLQAGLVEEAADELAADATSLVVGVEIDPRQVDRRRPVLDVEHAGVRSVGGDDLPLVRCEHAGVEVTSELLVPAPDGRDVGAHGGFVQLEAVLAVRGGHRPQVDDRHAARSVGRSTSPLPFEACSGADEDDEVGCGHGSPLLPGGLEELEDHPRGGGAGAGAAGDLGPQPDRERLDRRLGVVAVLGVADVLDGLLRVGLRGLRHGVEHICEIADYGWSARSR
nr:hypothetical protein [Streptomyces shenzhenensis]